MTDKRFAGLLADDLTRIAAEANKRPGFGNIVKKLQQFATSIRTVGPNPDTAVTPGDGFIGATADMLDGMPFDGTLTLPTPVSTVVSPTGTVTPNIFADVAEYFGIQADESLVGDDAADEYLARKKAVYKSVSADEIAADVKFAFRVDDSPAIKTAAEFANGRQREPDVGSPRNITQSLNDTAKEVEDKIEMTMAIRSYLDGKQNDLSSVSDDDIAKLRLERDEFRLLYTLEKEKT